MNMPATAAVVEDLEPVYYPVRRFEVADLSRHGKWIMPRLLAAFPNLNERSAASWLQTIIYQNEYLFLYHDHGVALAQVISINALSAKPIVQEIVVWVEDRSNNDQVVSAADFYVEFARWAKHQGAETIIVEEMSDVPHDLIKDKLGRIFTRQQQFARV